MGIDISKASEEVKICLDLLEKEVSQKVSELKKIRIERNKVKAGYNRLIGKYRYKRVKTKQEEEKTKDQIF